MNPDAKSRTRWRSKGMRIFLVLSRRSLLQIARVHASAVPFPGHEPILEVGEPQVGPGQDGTGERQRRSPVARARQVETKRRRITRIYVRQRLARGKRPEIRSTNHDLRPL